MQELEQAPFALVDRLYQRATVEAMYWRGRGLERYAREALEAPSRLALAAVRYDA